MLYLNNDNKNIKILSNTNKPIIIIFLNINIKYYIKKIAFS